MSSFTIPNDIAPEENWCLSNNTSEKNLELFKKSYEYIVKKHGIRLVDGRDAPKEFCWEDIKKFLEKYQDGLIALRDLSYLLNLKCLNLYHYDGYKLDSWIRENRDMFKCLDDEFYDVLAYNGAVFLNHYFSRNWESSIAESNFYKESLDEKYEKFNDNLNWFWACEF